MQNPEAFPEALRTPNCSLVQLAMLIAVTTNNEIVLGKAQSLHVHTSHARAHMRLRGDHPLQ